MALKGVFYSLLLLETLAESTGQRQKMLTVDMGTDSNIPSWPILSAGIFVAAALVLSLFLIFEHLAIYNQPEEQKFLIGVILMVPVYAVESTSESRWPYFVSNLLSPGRGHHFSPVRSPRGWPMEQPAPFWTRIYLILLSLLDSKITFICEIMRDCYEAFALYCFERYLIACLGGEENTIMIMEAQTQTSSSAPLLEVAYEDGVVKHPFPFNFCLRQWYLGSDFYQVVKIGIVQYMILKTICALLAIIFQTFGVYGEGKFEWKYGYPYLAVILNFSQTWALYCLLQFYSVTKERLEPIKPLPKFLAFKSIVFLTWWQGVIIAFLFSMGFVKSYLGQELKTRIQDYFICIEMGVAAVVHLYVFPATPYRRGERSIRNVAVLADYASLGAPPDPEEVRESARSTKMHLARSDDKGKRLSFPQSVRDVVVGSSEIMADDVKFTVSHVVEPVERGIARINDKFHQISENVKRIEKQRRKSKDDSYLIPMKPQTREFPDVYDIHPEGTVSDSDLGRRRYQQGKKTGGQPFWNSDFSSRSSFEFSGDRWD